MPVGYPALKTDIDARAGQLVLTLRDTLTRIQSLKLFLDAQSDGALTALGYSSADVTVLRAGITDLDNLRKVATALGTQAAANDFFYNAKYLVGVL
jgi:hypothetical protein